MNSKLHSYIPRLRESDTVVHLDLERAGDQRKIVDAEWFLSRQAGKLVILEKSSGLHAEGGENNEVCEILLHNLQLNCILSACG